MTDALPSPPTRGRSGDCSSTDTGRRAPLWARVILILAAVACLAVTALAGLNLYVINSYNTATEALHETIKLSKSQNIDPKAIESRQRQTDEQFRTIARFNPLLFDDLNSAISTNSKVSAKLTKATRRQVAAIEKAQRKAAATGQADPSSGASTGLTDEQRRQVEETLKANQPSSSDTHHRDEDDSQTSQHKDIKPW